MQYPQLPVGAAIGAILVLVPLPAHLRVRNIAVLSMILFIFSTNVINVVNTLVWAGNVKDVAPIWCDISEFVASSLIGMFLIYRPATNIQLLADISVALAGFCACKYLELVSSSRITTVDRHNRLVFEFLMCFVVPLIFIPFRMCLNYVTLGVRLIMQYQGTLSPRTAMPSWRILAASRPFTHQFPLLC